MSCFGAKIFTKLNDVPSSYFSQALKLVRVNALATALEFVALTDLNIPAPSNIDNTKNVAIATVTVLDTIVETTLYTGEIGADVLQVGNVLKFFASGILSCGAPADTVIVSIYFGSTLFLSFEPSIGKITNENWHMQGSMTVRTIGAAGTASYLMDIVVDDYETELIGLAAIDTTVSENFTLRVEWSSADAGNTISLYSGFTEWKNLN